MLEQELVAVGICCAVGNLGEGIDTHHPTWAPITRTAHYQLHAQLGPALNAMLTDNDPDQRATASYANFTTAIDTALQHGLPVLPVLAPVEELLDQNRQHTTREHLLHQAITALSTRTDDSARTERISLLDLAGRVAQVQQRFDQAEDYYRQALQAYRDTDDERAASQVATRLGRVLADTGRHTEAFPVLVEAAVGWRRSTGEFDSGDIGLLEDQRPHLDQHTIDGVIDALDPTTATALRQRLDQPDQT
ncbi:tetratricopeptide repeat protein [Nocardia sp. NBC_01377]|uniref:tetratricopeptide repeat protein n=1 Tax=Nocardia sp. NBC_01377 TaxID=2903595 RepID=UPI00324A3659